VNNIGAAAGHVLTILIRDSLSAVALLGYLLYLNWKLTLITLVTLPVLGVATRYFSKRLRAMSLKSQEATGDMLRVLQEATDGQKVIKVYGGHAYESARFEDLSRALRGYAMRMATSQAIGSPFTQFVAGVAIAGVVGMAIYLSTQHEMTAGMFSAFLYGMLMLIPPLRQLADVNAPLQRGIAAAESVFELVDASPEDDQGQQQLGRAKGDVAFEGVSLHYENAERAALSDISLAIRPGESVALVGTSGGGKTSLAHLIPRFYHASAGTIRIDGHAIEDLTLASLRSQIALVSQDVVLFNDSLAANIAYGAQRPASREAIEAAVKAAHLEEFVASQPQGLDTMIGERGTRLSGGQRQRLAIARAVLKDAPILILDEATSALDSESERHVQSALEALMKGRTTIVIAHRLSTIEHCDRVVVLQHGRIAEQGTHTELLAQGGAYARLYRIQYALDSAVL
jgi:subfamily B ATP-binding cassette protein MsbA